MRGNENVNNLNGTLMHAIARLMNGLKWNGFRAYPRNHPLLVSIILPWEIQLIVPNPRA